MIRGVSNQKGYLQCCHHFLQILVSLLTPSKCCTLLWMSWILRKTRVRSIAHSCKIEWGVRGAQNKWLHKTFLHMINALKSVSDRLLKCLSRLLLWVISMWPQQVLHYFMFHVVWQQLVHIGKWNLEHCKRVLIKVWHCKGKSFKQSHMTTQCHCKLSYQPFLSFFLCEICFVNPSVCMLSFVTVHMSSYIYVEYPLNLGAII